MNIFLSEASSCWYFHSLFSFTFSFFLVPSCSHSTILLETGLSFSNLLIAVHGCEAAKSPSRRSRVNCFISYTDFIMRFSNFISLLAVAAGLAEAGRSLRHVGKQDKVRDIHRRTPSYSRHTKRQESSFKYLTNSTSSMSSATEPITTLNGKCLLTISLEYAVNGSGIPEVDFDIGESYAGLMPISTKANETDQFYFWFFPSENPLASDEILIWLNGGVSRPLFTPVYHLS